MGRSSSFNWAWLVTAGLVTLGFSAAAPAAVQVIALSGDPAPDGNGNLSNFGVAPAITPGGQILFRADLTGTSGGNDDDGGVFRSDGLSLVQIAREGQAAPDGNGVISGFSNVAIDASGRSFFSAIFAQTAGGNSDNAGLLRGDGTALTQLVRKGQAAPDGNGTISSYGIHVDNNVGQSAFSASLAGTSGGSADNFGIFRADSAAVVQIARKGQAEPGGNGTFEHMGTPGLSDSSQVIFRALLSNTSGGGSDNEALYRGDGTSLTALVREGDFAPDGNGTVLSFNDPAVNNSGQAAFVGILSNTTGGSADDTVLLRADGTTLTQIARKGEAAPDGNGTLSSFSSPAFNNAGAAAFRAFLTGTTQGSADDSAIVVGNGSTTTLIAREGQTAPDGNGFLSVLHDAAINDVGQVAFSALLSGTAGGATDRNAVYFYDDLNGLVQVIRQGDSLLGSTITSVTFQNGAGWVGEERSGLDDGGHVAFRFALADGRSGIGVWAIPEPNSIVLLAGAGTVVLLRRGRGTCTAR